MVVKSNFLSEAFSVFILVFLGVTFHGCNINNKAFPLCYFQIETPRRLTSKKVGGQSPWLVHDKPHSFQGMWCRNARYIEILHLNEHFACIFTSGPFRLVLLLRNMAGFDSIANPLKGKGALGESGWLTIYASDVEVNRWTLLSKTHAFFHLRNWSINHLETTCVLTYIDKNLCQLTCAYIRIH